MVESGGSTSVVRAMSSKPITDTSLGTARPTERMPAYAPIAYISFTATMAVIPLPLVSSALAPTRPSSGASGSPNALLPEPAHTLAGSNSIPAARSARL